MAMPGQPSLNERLNGHKDVSATPPGVHIPPIPAFVDTGLAQVDASNGDQYLPAAPGH